MDGIELLISREEYKAAYSSAHFKKVDDIIRCMPTMDPVTASSFTDARDHVMGKALILNAQRSGL